MKVAIHTLFLFYCLMTSRCSPQNTINKRDSQQTAFLTWFVNQAKEPNISRTTAQLNIGLLSRIPHPKFTKQDSASIIQQTEESNKTVFSEKLSATKKMVDDLAFKKSVAIFYLKRSKPIIFGDKIWIYVEHFCGSNCASGEILAYKAEHKKYNLLYRKTICIS